MPGTPKAHTIKRGSQASVSAILERAHRQWDDGNLKSAFRLFLSGAKKGDSGAQMNLGTFYCDGIGLKPNRTMALYWYRRAYRQGNWGAASNIGLLFRDERKWKQALKWFNRGVSLGDTDANVDIAKILLNVMNDSAAAIPFLEKACQAEKYFITEASREEAQLLLKLIEVTNPNPGPKPI